MNVKRGPLICTAMSIRKKGLAEVAELADALGSGPSLLREVEVQILSSALVDKKGLTVILPQVLFVCADGALTQF